MSSNIGFFPQELQGASPAQLPEPSGFPAQTPDSNNGTGNVSTDQPQIPPTIPLPAQNSTQTAQDAPQQPNLDAPAGLVPKPATDHSQLNGGQNRKLASAVQLFVGDSPQALTTFTTPPQSKDDLFKRGIIDQNGNPTPKGVMASELKRKGLLNPDFTLNQTGALFAKKQSDYFSPDNTEGGLNPLTTDQWLKSDPNNYNRMMEWKKAKDLGLFGSDAEDKSKSESYSDILTNPEKLWDATTNVAKGIGKMVSDFSYVLQGDSGIKDAYDSKSPDDAARLAKVRDEKLTAARYGFVEGAVETFIQKGAEQGHLIGKGINSLMEEMGMMTPAEKEARNIAGEYASASLKDAFNKVNTVTTSLQAAGIDAAANELAATQKALGDKRFDTSNSRGSEVGSFVGDPVNLEIGPILGVLGGAAKSTYGLFDAAVNAKRIEKMVEVTAANTEANLNSVHAASYRTQAEVAQKVIDDTAALREQAVKDGDFASAGEHEQTISEAQKIVEKNNQAASYHEDIGATIKQAANSMENALPPTFQQRFMDAAKIPVSIPFKAMGQVVGKMGDALEWSDNTVSSIAKTFKVDKIRSWASAASVFTGHVNPVAVGNAVLQSHKVWQEAGRLLTSVGEELLTNQGTNPFFRRVAEGMDTPTGRLFATQLDNFIPPIAKGFGAISKGAAKAFVPSLVYETINQQGFTPDTIRRAAADSLVFGGGHGVYNAVTIGDPNAFIKTQIADRANYNEKLQASNPEQHKIYDEKVSPDLKNTIASITGAYPNLDIHYVEEGPSYNVGGKIVYNVNKPESLAKVTLLHEFSHALTNIHQAHQAVVQLMVGDKTRPGEIFNSDGTLSDEFSEFSNTYNERMKASGLPELNIHDMAIEMFTDKAAETMLADVNSGDLTRNAQRSKLSRSIGEVSQTILNKTPIIKSLHINLGGAIDTSGRMVMGSGLVSEGMRNSFGVQQLTRDLYKKSAGIPEFDINGNQTKGKTAADKKPSRQPRATQSTRDGVNNAKQAILDVNEQVKQAGGAVDPNALDPTTKRGMDGVPNDYQVKALIDSGAIHPEHLGTFANLVGHMHPDSTSTFVFKYRPAEQGRTIQADGITYHNIKPIGTNITKAGKIQISALDINQWHENVERVASSKQAKELGYTKDQILNDSHEASKYHIKNESPDPYFEAKYGQETARQRKGLISATYGEMTKAQSKFNPLVSETGGSRANQVYRTFSLEDIQRVIQTNESVRLSFDPNNYYANKVNLMPEVPVVDREGNPIENFKAKDFFENHTPYGERFQKSENADFSAPPNDLTAKDALSSSKQPYFGEHRKLPEGTDVGVRIDIPAYTGKGVYVQTVHEKGTPGDVGKRIGYDTHVRLKDGVRFFVKEGSETQGQGAMAIKDGRSNKHPIATVEGKISHDKTIPADINDWTPVGMNPKKHSYFYDKTTGNPVIGGSESYSVGNTVFVKDPVFAEKNKFRYMPEPTKAEISMPKGTPLISHDVKRFLPEPIEKLSDFIGKRVQVLTSDLSIVGDVQHGKYTAEFKGGPGYLDNNGWGFTDKSAADAFVTRWEKDGKPLIGLASLGPANHLNSLDARRAYGEKWKHLVDDGMISKKDATAHITEAMKRIQESNAKSVKPAWKEVASKITNADQLANYFDKIPWAAAPMFYDKLTARTLPISYDVLVKHGLDLESSAKQYRQPEFHHAELGDLYAIAQFDGSSPDYKPDLNKAYPWRIKFSKKATLSEMHNVGDLTTDPRAFAGKQVGGRLGAQPLMVTGINLDRLMTNDIGSSGKSLSLHPATAKTKSNKASEFGSGNPSGYKPYVDNSAPVPKVIKPKVSLKSSVKAITATASMNK